ncbi:hypothetical protein Y1Q_0001491 [Alligator mississippiensis]|uniref:Uncharacterized protein n=1 Tax=Alligator mississippiensis TaxID=8496 RepID=A0A151M9M6_ALLMI|nr:hypothetical protein Y1Q_0001491 [Alligator mississippiensis]
MNSAGISQSTVFRKYCKIFYFEKAFSPYKSDTRNGGTTKPPNHQDYKNVKENEVNIFVVQNNWGRLAGANDLENVLNNLQSYWDPTCSSICLKFGQPFSDPKRMTMVKKHITTYVLLH